jgi:5-(carboxyamino)imidazole ribonucleotide synthase
VTFGNVRAVTRVAVLGGGQLGQMLGLAGIPLGCSFGFLDPSPLAPAGGIGDLVVGGLDDLAAARKAASGATVVTYEWEGVPAGIARALQTDTPVLPPPRALEVSQDRLVEKDTFQALGIATAPYRAVDDRASLRAAVGALGVPAVLKTRRGGYDGKGQFVLRTAADLDAAWRALGGVPLILEGFVAFQRELSIVAVRGADGAVAYWPAVENHHVDGILHLSRAPAPDLDAATQARAQACIGPLLESLEYVGVGCVELFSVDGALLANEMAPRVHNSGHWTIEGAETSQFENHLRAVLGWPLGSTAPLGHSAMINCVATMPDRDSILAVPGAHLHDYGKEARPGRKLGHVTVIAPDEATLEERLASVEKIVGPRATVAPGASREPIARSECPETKGATSGSSAPRSVDRSTSM